MAAGDRDTRSGGRNRRSTKLDGSGVANVAGDVDIVMVPQPRAGYVWSLRRLTVAGFPTPATLLPGSLELYTGINCNPWDLIDVSTQIPNVGPWGAGQVPLFPGAPLVIRVKGTTPGVTLVIGGRADVETDAEYSGAHAPAGASAGERGDR